MSLLININGKAQTVKGPQVKTANGVLQGVDEASGIRSFKGIPFAQPPVGDLRWKEPQPAANWQGVRMADHFGAQAMQQHLYSDMIFRSAGKSEDCLYLNVWAPKAGTKKLPVLVYFYGGGFTTGDGSEGRYDGESMAKKGIVAVTVNYRLGVFGFMAHPELTKESPHHSSGNYGLMDQHAALVWVKNNIAAFGGDPAQVTIAGESAGSMSVSAQIASPLSTGLFRSAIAESGALMGNLSPTPLATAEQSGLAFATRVKATSLADLRKIPADTLLKWGARGRFGCTVDGYFLPEQPQAIFAAGKQMKVALLAGWNSAEGDFHSILGRNVTPTPENYKAAIQRLYNDKAADILTHYPANTEDEVKASGNALASDRFIAFSTWKMVDLQARTQSKPVYRYWYIQPRPMLATDKEKPAGAVHSAEIEYAMGNLHYNKTYNWTAEDLKTSEVMQNYFANFVKTGNPNGPSLPVWNAMQSTANDKVMVIDANTHAIPDQTKARYDYMDGILGK
ncbi:MAG: carboxylesterase family protein [Mucilaginibacter sp.]